MCSSSRRCACPQGRAVLVSSPRLSDKEIRGRLLGRSASARPVWGPHPTSSCSAKRVFISLLGPPAPWLSEPWSSCLPPGISRTLPCQPPPALTPRGPCVSHMCCFLSLGRPEQGRVENTDRSCAHCRDRHHSRHPFAPHRPCAYRAGHLPWTGSPRLRPLGTAHRHLASLLASGVVSLFFSSSICPCNSGFMNSYFICIH